MMDFPEREREEMYKVKPDLMPLVDCYKRFGSGGDIVERVQNTVDPDRMDIDWSPSLKSFRVVSEDMDLRHILSHMGDDSVRDAATAVFGAMGADEDPDEYRSYLPESIQVDWKEALAALPLRQLDQISQYLDASYGYIEEWQEETGQTYDFTDPAHIAAMIEFCQDKDLPLELANARRWGYAVGSEEDTKASLLLALSKSIYVPVNSKRLWEGWWQPTLPLHEVMDLITGVEPGDEPQAITSHLKTFNNPRVGTNRVKWEDSQAWFVTCDDEAAAASFEAQFGPEYREVMATKRRNERNRRVAGKAASGAILRIMTRDEAIAIRHDANINGKHKDNTEGLEAFYVGMPQGEYVQVRLPLSRLDHIEQNGDREREYAERPGSFPPIYVTYNEWKAKRNDDGVGAVLDGNHRSCAAVLRGDTEIDAIMPKADYDRFMQAPCEAKAKVAGKTAMNVTVPESEIANGHFWEEPPAGSEEFWAFRWPVKAQVGDRVVFNLNKKPIAEAVISRIEKPGESECAETGRFGNKWKVFWTQDSFRKLEPKTALLKVQKDLPGGYFHGKVTETDEELMKDLGDYGIDELPPSLAYTVGQKVAILDFIEAHEAGNGAGRDLMTEFLGQAAQAGAVCALLITDTDRKQKRGFTLLRWYKSLGFEKVLKLDADYLMAKRLYPTNMPPSSLEEEDQTLKEASMRTEQDYLDRERKGDEASSLDTSLARLHELAQDPSRSVREMALKTIEAHGEFAMAKRKRDEATDARIYAIVDKNFLPEFPPDEPPPVKPTRPFLLRRSVIVASDPETAQTSVTDTPAFKAWFGASKVVDASGKPLVMFHGTPHDFKNDQFQVGGGGRGSVESLGFHFGPSEAANTRLEKGMKNYDAHHYNWNVMPVYLSIVNPLRIGDAGAWHSPTRVAHWLETKGGIDRTALQEALTKTGHTAKMRAIKKVILDAGYDGLVYHNEHEGGGDSWIALDPRQIKSAIGNGGDFNPKSRKLTAARTPDLQAIISKYKALGVDSYISQSPDQPVIISQIIVPKDERNQGLGTAMMEDLVRWADSTGTVLALTPSKEYGASSVARLQSFYRRFGFEKNRGRNKDWSTQESMVRKPKTT